jgi:CheY-like chemotaxis protein
MNQYIATSLLDKLKVLNKVAQDGLTAINMVEQRKQQNCCDHFSIIFIDGNNSDIDSIDVHQMNKCIGGF